jgi:peptide/nickel transport system substrate-binding protein
MNRKTLVLPAVVGLLAPALAACGGSEQESGKDQAIVVGTTDKIIADKLSPAPLDPAYAYDTASWNVLRQTTQSLLYTPRGGKPMPDAASSCEFTDNASQSFRCKLRDGLKFSDGSPVTVEDVKFSIERLLRINDANGAAALLSNVDTIDTKGNEIVFHLTTPDATFPYKLSTPVAAIVSQKKYDGTKLRAGFEVHASGPYTMKAEAKGEGVTKLVFSRNKSYRGGITELHNSKVEVRVFEEPDAMVKALKDGDIHVATREMSAQHVKSMLDRPEKKIELTEMSGLTSHYLAFNTGLPQVKDKAVRQAMAALIDRGEISAKVYESTAEPLYSIIPATIGAHKNSFYNRYGDPDRKKARKILQEAGITTPVKVSIHYANDRDSTEEYQLVAKQLNDSKLFEAKAVGSKWTEFRDGSKRGAYPVFSVGWVPDYPDPDNFTAPFLDKENFLNSPYSNAEISKLIPQSRRQADRSAATKTFSRIQDIVAEEVPLIPVWQSKNYIAAQANITGVERLYNASADIQLWELGTTA